MREIAALLLAACAAIGHETISTKLTWSAEISRIIFKRCAHCHHDGGTAFSLMTYAEARPWAKAIKEEVLERRMPPWGAVAGFGSFAADQALSMEELHLLSDWVEGGAPEGDPKYAPDPPPLQTPARFRARPGLTVRGEMKLPAPRTIAAVRPEQVPDKGSLRAVAIYPSGQVEPLIWVHNWQTRHPRNFTFQEPLKLPAGSIVQVSGQGQIVLLAR
jgi:hypothetical protein